MTEEEQRKVDNKEAMRERARLLIAQQDKNTPEGKLYRYECSLRRKSLKDLVKAFISLAPIIYTEEGRAKVDVLRKFVPEHRIDKFNSYLTYYNKINKRYSNFLTVQARLLDVEESLHFIYSLLKREGLYIYRLNTLLKYSIPSGEAIKEITKKYTGSTLIRYNGRENRFYLSLSPEFPKRLEWIRERYAGHLQEAKALTIALEEYISNNPVASEFIPKEVQDVIDISFKKDNIRFDMDFIKRWLKDIEKVEDTTLLKEWEKELSTATENKDYKPFFPSFEEIEANPNRLIEITGDNNLFEND